MYFNLFKRLERGTLRLRRKETSQYKQYLSFSDIFTSFLVVTERIHQQSIVSPGFIRLKQSVENSNFCTPCSSIVDLKSVNYNEREREVSKGKMIMKDGAMLDTFLSSPLLILPLLLFQLYSTFQLRLLSVTHYLSHFSTFTLTMWNWQRPTVYLYISFIVEEYENWLKFVNNINKGW